MSHSKRKLSNKQISLSLESCKYVCTFLQLFIQCICHAIHLCHCNSVNLPKAKIYCKPFNFANFIIWLYIIKNLNYIHAQYTFGSISILHVFAVGTYIQGHYILGPKRTQLDSNVCSNERIVKCGLSNSNYKKELYVEWSTVISIVSEYGV